MYDFLFDQTYINLFVLALLLFLVMFLWRKVTIIEGNYFLLEKRVNIIKKEGREDLLTKNMEKSHAVMNEIFRDSVTTKPCNNLNDECNIKASTNICNDTSCDFRNDIKHYTEDMADITGIKDIVDISINYFDFSEDTPNNKIEIIDEPEYVSQVSQVVQVSQVADVAGVADVARVADVMHIEPEEVMVTPIELINNINNINNIDVCDITDTGSVCSDITFNNEDKSISKRYKNMNVDKLREECKEKSLNTEGSKAVLISRLVDNIKKQK